MSGFITIEDGRSYARANWAYDAVIDAIARELPATPLGREFLDWLLNQRCFDRSTGDAICGNGLGNVDLRVLSPSCRQLFWDAAHAAYETCQRDGGSSWHNPDGFPQWLKSFGELLFLHETYRDGDPPHDFNPHMNGLIPPTDQQVGPGW
ncbi:hypothetical protein [Rhodopirellula bahusiensis]|uniref:hypothetical protein n=1 Tax=Rhodopirellula bahusiensis TaxID=2014065 RepID=UPI003262F622